MRILNRSLLDLIRALSLTCGRFGELRVLSLLNTLSAVWSDSSSHRAARLARCNGAEIRCPTRARHLTYRASGAGKVPPYRVSIPVKLQEYPGVLQEYVARLLTGAGFSTPTLNLETIS